MGEEGGDKTTATGVALPSILRLRWARASDKSIDQIRWLLLDREHHSLLPLGRVLVPARGALIYQWPDPSSTSTNSHSNSSAAVGDSRTPSKTHIRVDEALPLMPSQGSSLPWILLEHTALQRRWESRRSTGSIHYQRNKCAPRTEFVVTWAASTHDC